MELETILSPPSLFAFSKFLTSTRSHLRCHLTNPPPPTRSLTTRVLTRRRPLAADLSKPSLFGSSCLLPAAVRCDSSSAPLFAYGGGSGGGGIDGGGGGDGGGDGSEGGNPKVSRVSGDVDDVSALSPDVILLDVGGMTCGGCAASVKRILESQPQVSSASVNLATETAIVWPVSEAKVVPNWRVELGEMLSKQLTSCGFQSKLRGEGDKEGEVPS